MNEVCGYCGAMFNPTDSLRLINGVAYHSCDKTVSCYILILQRMNEIECHTCNNTILNDESAWGIVNGKTYHYPDCYPE